jgi:hypothetical protein
VLPQLKELQQKWKGRGRNTQGETRAQVAEEVIKAIEG